METRGRGNLSRLRMRSGNGGRSEAPQVFDVSAAGEAVAEPAAASAYDAVADSIGAGDAGELVEEGRDAVAGNTGEASVMTAPVRPVDQDRAGWVSPQYTKSRTVGLNPRTLELNRCIAFHVDVPEVEQYRVLRTRIMQRAGTGEGSTIMVTSALPGEGKTLTAINLALTFAREFQQTVLLVDCDLRRQNIHKTLGYASDKGLSDYLLDDCPISELFVWPSVEKLSVISGGRVVKDGSELLGSPGMRRLVTEMKTRYPGRFVIFDVPPVLTGADALAFAPLVDGILLTVQAGQTPVQEVTKALNLLPRDKVLGTVLNRHKGSLPSYPA